MAFKEEKKDPNYIFQLERNIKAYMFWLILILSSIIISLSLAIMFLAPFKEVKPYLLFFSKADNNFVRVEQGNFNVRNDIALMKNILAGYVINRETINRINDLQRYEETREQSSKQVWTLFYNLVTNKKSIYGEKNIFRKVEIINVAILSKNVATIDFYATLTNLNTGEESFKKYRATIKYDFKKIEITTSSLPKNPTGFIVEKYALTEIQDIDKLNNKEVK